MIEYKVNIFVPFIVSFMLWAGITERISWWVILLVVLNEVKLDLIFKR